MVKSVTAIILHAIAGDLECWTCGTKELAANFLLTLMLFAEDSITMHLQPLIKLLHRALAEATIAAKVNPLLESPVSCTQVNNTPQLCFRPSTFNIHWVHGRKHLFTEDSQLIADYSVIHLCRFWRARSFWVFL